jgi:hypothetical protein
MSGGREDAKGEGPLPADEAEVARIVRHHRRADAPRAQRDQDVVQQGREQLTTALLSGSAALVTHDRDFRDVRDIPILTGG